MFYDAFKEKRTVKYQFVLLKALFLNKAMLWFKPKMGCKQRRFMTALLYIQRQANYPCRQQHVGDNRLKSQTRNNFWKMQKRTTPPPKAEHNWLNAILKKHKKWWPWCNDNAHPARDLCELPYSCVFNSQGDFLYKELFSWKRFLSELNVWIL